MKNQDAKNTLSLVKAKNNLVKIVDECNKSQDAKKTLKFWHQDITMDTISILNNTNFLDLLQDKEKIKTVEFLRCNTGLNRLAYVLDALQENEVDIESLSISDIKNLLAGGGAGYTGSIENAKLGFKNFNSQLSNISSTLKTLTLKSIDMSELAAKTLSQVLPKLVNLKVLDISYNPTMGKEGVSEITKALVDAKNLEQLNLNSDKVYADSFESVANLITKNKSIKILNIQDTHSDYIRDVLLNYVNSQGDKFVTLIDALTKNNTIESLSIILYPKIEQRLALQLKNNVNYIQFNTTNPNEATIFFHDTKTCYTEELNQLTERNQNLSKHFSDANLWNATGELKLLSNGAIKYLSKCNTGTLYNKIIEQKQIDQQGFNNFMATVLDTNVVLYKFLELNKVCKSSDNKDISFYCLPRELQDYIFSFCIDPVLDIAIIDDLREYDFLITGDNYIDNFEI